VRRKVYRKLALLTFSPVVCALHLDNAHISCSRESNALSDPITEGFLTDGMGGCFRRSTAYLATD